MAQKDLKWKYLITHRHLKYIIQDTKKYPQNYNILDIHKITIYWQYIQYKTSSSKICYTTRHKKHIHKITIYWQYIQYKTSSSKICYTTRHTKTYPQNYNILALQ